MQDLTQSEVEALSKVLGAQMKAEHPQSNESIPSSGVSAPVVSRVQFGQLSEEDQPGENSQKLLETMQNLKIKLEVIYGETRLPLKKILKMSPGDLIPLDKFAGEPLEILANGKPIARGEAIVIDDHFGVRILEILSADNSIIGETGL
jgi:flagellar motor switch protein FliN/FliY